MLVSDNCELSVAFVLGGFNFHSLVEDVECTMDVNFETHKRVGNDLSASGLEIGD